MRRSCLLFGALLGLAVSARAQVEEKLLGLLREGDLRGALAMLQRGVPLADPAARIEISERLFAAAVLPVTEATLRSPALEHAVDVLRDGVPPALADRRAAIAHRAVLARVDDVLAEPCEPGDKAWRAALSDLRFARGVLSTPERRHGEEHRAIGMRLVPLLRAGEEWLELRSLAEDLLENPTLGERERAAVREDLGVALVGVGRARDGLPLLQDAIAKRPRDPVFIGPIASALYRKDPEIAFDLLQPVLAADPAPPERSAYRSALTTFYRLVERLPSNEPPLEPFLARRTVDEDLPTIWPARHWGAGYRTWRPDNVVPGKQYAGRHGVRAFLPASHGWSATRPPDDLRRWGQYAFCFQRGGGDGPIAILYWYGPDLFYWYGHTDEKRGVTGKSARGDSRGAIASLVEDICYDEAARELGHAYRRTRPLPMNPGVRGTRQAYQRDEWIYDETFFSLGQVTCELLVRIRESDVDWLEPELRWFYANVRAR